MSAGPVAADGVARQPVPRLVITGSESTGKTTLAAELAERLGTVWVPEFSRRYAETIGRPLTADDVEPIAAGQRAAEDEGEARWRTRFGQDAGAPPLVLDTDLVSTVVYARHYYGACPPWIESAARERRAARYLLCAPDLPWRADHVRDRPRARDELHAAFVAALGALGAHVVTIAGTGPDRLRAALAALAVGDGGPAGAPPRNSPP